MNGLPGDRQPDSAGPDGSPRSLAPQPPGMGGAPSGGAGRPVSARLPVQRVRATYVLLGLITVVFIAQLASIQLTGVDMIIDLGAKDNQLIAHGEYWRLFTAIFVHASALHFGFNAYALYIIGRDVETFSGPLRLTLVFLLAGLSGSVFSMLFNPSPSVGASGAIFGLIGALAVFLYRNRQIFGERGRRNLQNVVIIAAINFLFGLRGGIDNWAHLGGLIGGLILGWFMGPVWAVTWEAMQGGQPSITDTQPLGARQWVLALAFLVGLAALALVAASFNGASIR